MFFSLISPISSVIKQWFSHTFSQSEISLGALSNLNKISPKFSLTLTKKSQTAKPHIAKLSRKSWGLRKFIFLQFFQIDNVPVHCTIYLVLVPVQTIPGRTRILANARYILAFQKKCRVSEYSAELSSFMPSKMLMPSFMPSLFR